MLLNHFNVACADMEFINTRCVYFLHKAEFPISGYDCYDLVVSNGKHGGDLMVSVIFLHGFLDLTPW